MTQTQTPAAAIDVATPDKARTSRDNPSDTPDNLDAVIPPHTPDALPVVGLGGSAGAIAALREFFRVLPPDSGMAYIVVMHLAPDHESTLPEILQRETAMPVVAVTQRLKVEANRVYVIAPDQQLSMNDGHIEVEPLEVLKGKRVAVDLFFRTLAEARGSSCVGIILSGADGDGAIGLKRIKERGGLTVAQAPGEADHEGMPRSAIATGMVDWILPVGEMPARLLDFRRNEQQLRLPPEAVAPVDGAQQNEAQRAYSDDDKARDEAALREILALLKARVGHDFSHYKRATVLRRIGRRLQVNSLPDIPTYADFLRVHPGEAGALLQDLLINVTNFFRDPAAFEALHEIVPRLFAGKTASDQVRVWVAGCATGEEAYSVAMLLHEYAARLEAPPSILVFATDISDTAIQVARDGSYPATIAADVSPERLRLFFTYANGCYRVRKSLRESVLFAAHNLLNDPPFSRLDLVTCRNLLIYLNRDAQNHAFEIFHFSLHENGLLFLGTSESADDRANLFSNFDKKHKLYERRAGVKKIGLPLSLNAPRSVSPLPLLTHTENSAPVAALPDAARLGSAEVHRGLLELYAPPSIVVNENYDVLHLSQSAGRYLQFSEGEPSNNLLRMAHPDLRLELGTALFTASQSGEAVSVGGVAAPGGDKALTLHVRPAPEENGQRLFLVLFEPGGAAPVVPIAIGAEPMARQLGEEVQHLKNQLRATIEQYETSNEELKASNEELQAMNEEARSTGEELETSREELQSVNEELVTVNQELKNKVEETGRANSDLSSLMISTDIAVIFLNRAFHIRRYTPRARELFNIIPTDIERSLFDLTHHLDYAGLQADAESVLRKLQPIEREVNTYDNRVFLARVLPYRTEDDHIEGVVLTFFDITNRKRAEAALLESQERLHSIANLAPDLLWTSDADGSTNWYNQRWLEYTGQSLEEATGWGWAGVIHPDDREASARRYNEAFKNGGILRQEHRIRRYDGKYHWFVVNVFPFKDENGNVIRMYGAATDIHELRLTNEALRASEEKYRTLFDSIDEGFSVVEMVFDEGGKAVDYIFRELNPTHKKLTGLPVDIVGRRISELMPNLEEEVLESFGKVMLTGEPVRYEQYIGALDRWFDVYTVRVGGSDSRLVANVFNNITERKQREQQQEYLVRLNDALRPLADPMEVQRVAMRVLGEHLQADRTIYAEINLDENWFDVTDNYATESVQKVIGRFSFSAFGPTGDTLKNGESLIIHDVNADVDDDSKKAFGSIGVQAVVAVPLLKQGKLVADLSVHQTTPRRWLDHEIALVKETAERTWAAVERAKVEADLRESEEKFRSIFENIDEGFAIQELITDENGNVTDAIYLEVNDAFERHAGIKNAPGRKASEFAPYLEQHWLDALTRVYQTGEPVRMEGYQADLNRWFTAQYSPVGGAGSRFIAVVFDDITEHKAREREQEFLLQLSDALRAEQGSDAVASRALEMLIEELRLDRSYITTYYLDENRADVDYQIGNDSVPPLPDHFVLSDFPEAVKSVSENTVVIEDDWERQGVSEAEKCNRKKLGMRATVSATLRKENQPLWTMVAINSRSRRWTQGEIALVEAVAERTWAAIERARAEESLRESEERLRVLIENLPGGAVFVVDKDLRYLIAAGEALIKAGFKSKDLIGRTIQEVMPPELAETYQSLYRQVLRGEAFEREHEAHDRTFISRGVPLKNEAGEIYAVLAISYDITTRKQAEAALRQSEERLRLAVEAGGLGAWEWNLKTGEVFWNEQHFLLFGMQPRPNPLTAEDFFSHVHPDDRERVAGELEQATREKTVFQSDFRAVLDSGETRWMSGYGRVVIENGDGEPVKMSGLMFDITDRKRAEEELRASENRFRRLSDAVPQIIWTNSSDGSANYFNSRWFEYSGLSLEASCGPGWQAIVHPDDAPASVERWNAALSSGEIFDTEYRLRRHDGVYRWFIGRNVPLKNGNGEVLGWFGSATDIEDFKRAEAALRESQERFRVFIEGVEDYAIFMADPDGTLVTWNIGVERVLGYGEDSWLGQNVAIIFTPEDRAGGEVENEMATAAREGRALDEGWHLRQSGERFFANGVLLALRDENQNLTGYAKIMRDMTQRKRMEDELQSAHDELESRVAERTREIVSQTGELRQSEAARGLLLQRVVDAQEDERRRISRELHDQMGQQLTALLMGLRALPAAREPERHSSANAQGIEKLQLIAEDLMDRAHRLAWQTRPAILDTVGLQAALQQGVKEWSEQSGVAADFIAHGLGSERLNDTLETAFYRVVLEALTNVQRHAQAQSVSVSLERKGDTVSAIIEDDGVGFSVEAGAPSRLGLLGMRERMELVGGSLEIESSPEGGTAVYARAKV